MNPWALDKDHSIRLLLVRLHEALGDDAFEVDEDWESEHRAVRLRKPGEPELRFYIYSYAQGRDHYGVHLEYPQLPDNQPLLVAGGQEEVDFPHLLELLCTHFDVPPPVDARRTPAV